MSFYDYVYYILCAIVFLQGFIIITWRITCFFKKSCKWKKCPYRQEYHLSLRTGWLEMGCKKFPQTQEELDEEDKMLDQLEILIEQLSEQRRKHPEE